MNETLVDLLIHNWPTLAVFAALLYGIYHVLKALALTFDGIAEVLGPIGKLWRARRTISQAESDDLRTRLTYLAEQVRRLRHRDECYFSYTIVDAEWHRKQELVAITHGWALEPHVGFLDFSEKWMAERGLDREVDIWM